MLYKIYYYIGWVFNKIENGIQYVWNKLPNEWLWLIGSLLYIIFLGILSVPLWGQFGDPYTMIRMIIGTNISVVQAVVLSILSLNALDRFTEGDWFAEIAKGNMAAGIVTAMLVYCVFWLSIRG